MTAFLHLLALKDHRQAETQGKRQEERLSVLEDDTRPLNPPSRAEVLGTYQTFVFVWEKDHISLSTQASIFASVLLRDNIDATSHVSLMGKKRFLLLFMGES